MVTLPTSKLYLNSSQISIPNNILFPRTEKVNRSIWHNPMSRPLPTLNLRPDFHAVAEGERHPAVRINHCIIHKPIEQLSIEIHRRLPRSSKPCKEAVENVILDFLIISSLQPLNQCHHLQPYIHITVRCRPQPDRQYRNRLLSEPVVMP